MLVGGWSTDGCVLCIVLVTRLVRGDSGGDPGLVLLYVCEGGVEGGGLKLEMLGCLVIEHYLLLTLVTLLELNLVLEFVQLLQVFHILIDLRPVNL